MAKFKIVVLSFNNRYQNKNGCIVEVGINLFEGLVQSGCLGTTKHYHGRKYSSVSQTLACENECNCTKNFRSCI